MAIVKETKGGGAAMNIKRIFATIAAVALSGNAWADSRSGTIHTLHVNLQSRMAHVYLDGLPTFQGGSCSGTWTGNSIDDQDFLIYIWPALMSAKNKGFAVTIEVSGCLNGYPKIVSIDVVPRYQ